MSELRNQIAALEPQQIVGAELPARLDQLADDSREVTPGGAFVAISTGGRNDGHAFIDSALEHGARVVFCEKVPASVAERSDVTFVVLESTRAQLPQIAECVFGRPADDLQVIGVTGTNGKTTSTFLIESIGALLGRRVGVIGTISHRYPGFHEVAVNTTPDVVKTTGLLRQMADARCELVAMEVSSHGLDIGRVDGISFDVGVFTSFSQDHLDYHETMADYLAAKLRLFDTLLPAAQSIGKKPWAVVNSDDPEVRAQFIDGELAAGFGDRLRWYGTRPPCDDHPALLAEQLELVGDRWRGTLYDTDTGRRAAVELPLLGRFNVLNALGATAACLALGEDLDALAAVWPDIAQVPGRMERVGRDAAQPLVVVDYAHSPDAIARALEAVRATGAERVTVVFGAGGDRDAGKRPQMGAAAARGADLVVVTNDNPRSESPGDIADQILAGVAAEARDRVVVELDRKRAVELAIARSGAADAVLVAGKGHEPYQIIGNTRLDLDDRQLARDALAAWRPTPRTE